MMPPMLTTTTGRYFLLYAAASVAVGYFILMKLADIEY
jgi:Flp pilus assembly protein TadB